MFLIFLYIPSFHIVVYILHYKIIASAIGKTSAAHTVLESLDVTKYSILTINMSAQVGTNSTTEFILIWKHYNNCCISENLLLYFWIQIISWNSYSINRDFDFLFKFAVGRLCHHFYMNVLLCWCRLSWMTTVRNLKH